MRTVVNIQNLPASTSVVASGVLRVSIGAQRQPVVSASMPGNVATGRASVLPDSSWDRMDNPFVTYGGTWGNDGTWNDSDAWTDDVAEWVGNMAVVPSAKIVEQKMIEG